MAVYKIKKGLIFNTPIHGYLKDPEFELYKRKWGKWIHVDNFASRQKAELHVKKEHGRLIGGFQFAHPEREDYGA